MCQVSSTALVVIFLEHKLTPDSLTTNPNQTATYLPRYRVLENKAFANTFANRFAKVFAAANPLLLLLFLKNIYITLAILADMTIGIETLSGGGIFLEKSLRSFFEAVRGSRY